MTTTAPQVTMPTEPLGDFVVLDATANAWVRDAEGGYWVNEDSPDSPLAWVGLCARNPWDQLRVYGNLRQQREQIASAIETDAAERYDVAYVGGGLQREAANHAAAIARGEVS
jgi:hypothetical protein